LFVIEEIYGSATVFFLKNKMEEVARAMSAGGEEIKIENKTLKLEKFRLIQKTDLKLILNK